jgi:hypothetical protein
MVLRSGTLATRERSTIPFGLPLFWCIKRSAMREMTLPDTSSDKAAEAPTDNHQFAAR